MSYLDSSQHVCNERVAHRTGADRWPSLWCPLSQHAATFLTWCSQVWWTPSWLTGRLLSSFSRFLTLISSYVNVVIHELSFCQLSFNIVPPSDLKVYGNICVLWSVTWNYRPSNDMDYYSYCVRVAAIKTAFTNSCVTCVLCVFAGMLEWLPTRCSQSSVQEGLCVSISTTVVEESKSSPFTSA